MISGDSRIIGYTWSISDVLDMWDTMDSRII